MERKGKNSWSWVEGVEGKEDEKKMEEEGKGKEGRIDEGTREKEREGR